MTSTTRSRPSATSPGNVKGEADDFHGRADTKLNIPKLWSSVLNAWTL